LHIDHQQHHSSHLISRTPRSTLKIKPQKSQQAISHHGHIEEHQELIKRRSRAARKQEQGGQPKQIKQDKATTRSRSRRSRREPEPSPTPTSLLLKFQQQGEQLKNKQ
jgi:hypothetical protein